MKDLLLLAVFALSLATSLPLHAQWKTETYALRGGWNGIYLHGDASHQTPAELFADHPEVLEVWRWNPNPNQVQFTTSPAIPSESANEWTVWKRDDPDEQTLTGLIAQSAYLIRCDGDANAVISVSIPQRPVPPSATWLISGANFHGFPAAASTPLMTSYFASFPRAISAPSKVYKYIGGPLNDNNPLQVSASAERLNRHSAYWFEVAAVSDFTAPVEYELPGRSGLAFGRTGSILTMGIMNRTTSAMTLTISPVASEPAPAGQPQITGPVPLTHRTFDHATNTYAETPIVGAIAVTVEPSGRLDLQFGVDRSQLGTSSVDFFASLLRITDSAGLSDVFLPVTAQVASPAGLWIGEVSVDSVVSTVAGSPGDTTARPFPLRAIIHVDGSGTARLLSQVYVGKLDVAGNPNGIATREDALQPTAKADALRIVSSQMPLDRAIEGTGSFAIGQTLEHTITIPFDDPTNPFVHTYHPDHDNRDARLNPLPAGVESYDIVRRCAFTFTAEPPDGYAITGWGTTVYGGTYSETIFGLNRSPLTVGGTFLFRRLSEIAEITLD